MRAFDISSFDYPGCAFAILPGGDDAGVNQAKHRHGTQIEHPGCFKQRDFAALGPFAIPVDRDPVRVAKGPHTRLCPSIQSACSLSCPVEHAGNSLVGHQSCAGADQLHSLGLDGPTRLPPPVLSHCQAGVIAALPMQQQMNLVILDATAPVRAPTRSGAVFRRTGARIA